LMLLVDSRAGSRDLVKPLAKVLGTDNVEETTLDFGDVAFTGRGPNNTPLDIGIEHKQVADIVACCRDGRFAGHQLPGMRKRFVYKLATVRQRTNTY
jgi:ERCC4-type nuclease